MILSFADVLMARLNRQWWGCLEINETKFSSEFCQYQLVRDNILSITHVMPIDLHTGTYYFAY